MESGVTKAAANRKIRQDALREQLSQQKLVEKVVDIARKLEDLANNMDGLQVQRLKAAADINQRLINKYLPDLKSTEHTGEGGGDIGHSISVEVVGVDASRDTE